MFNSFFYVYHDDFPIKTGDLPPWKNGDVQHRQVLDISSLLGGNLLREKRTCHDWTTSFYPYLTYILYIYYIYIYYIYRLQYHIHLDKSRHIYILHTSRWYDADVIRNIMNWNATIQNGNPRRERLNHWDIRNHLPRLKRCRKSPFFFGNPSMGHGKHMLTYCGWKKSCTTLDG